MACDYPYLPVRPGVKVKGIMVDSLSEELGRRIRLARTGRFTQAELAQKIGLSRTAVTNIECGRQRLLVDQLVDIADALNVSAADLLPSSRPTTKPDQVSHPALPEMPTVSRWIKSVKSSAT